MCRDRLEKEEARGILGMYYRMPGTESYPRLALNSLSVGGCSCTAPCLYLFCGVHSVLSFCDAGAAIQGFASSNRALLRLSYNSSQAFLGLTHTLSVGAIHRFALTWAPDSEEQGACLLVSLVLSTDTQ